MEQEFDNIDWCLDYFSKIYKSEKQESQDISSDSESESSLREDIDSQDNDSISGDFLVK